MILASIKHLKEKLSDTKTIRDLCVGAEHQAKAHGEQLPGVEHYMLAAIELPDGTAKQFFQSFGIGLHDLNQAIKQQHLKALSHLGIDTESAAAYFDEEPIASNNLLFHVQPSAKKLMKSLYEHNKHRNQPLLSIHVIEVILSMEYGVAIRTLEILDVNLTDMRQAIRQQIHSSV